LKESGYGKQLKIVSQWTKIVIEEGPISKWALMDRLKITINQYNQLQGYVLYKQGKIINYDKATGVWKLNTESLTSAYQEKNLETFR